jgi:hypothetical protein
MGTQMINCIESSMMDTNMRAIAALQNHQWQRSIQLLQQGLLTMKNQIASLRRNDSYGYAIETLPSSSASSDYDSGTIFHVIPIPSLSPCGMEEPSHATVNSFDVYHFVFAAVPSDRHGEGNETFVGCHQHDKNATLCYETVAILAYNLAFAFQMAGLRTCDDLLWRKAIKMYDVAAEMLYSVITTNNIGNSIKHKWKLLSLAIYNNMIKLYSMKHQEDSANNCLRRIEHWLGLNCNDRTLNQLLFVTYPSLALDSASFHHSQEVLQRHYKFFSITLMCSRASRVNAAAA